MLNQANSDSEATGLVDEGRAADVVYFQKTSKALLLHPQ